MTLHISWHFSTISMQKKFRATREFEVIENDEICVISDSKFAFAIRSRENFLPKPGNWKILATPLVIKNERYLRHRAMRRYSRFGARFGREGNARPAFCRSRLVESSVRRSERGIIDCCSRPTVRLHMGEVQFVGRAGVRACADSSSRIRHGQRYRWTGTPI